MQYLSQSVLIVAIAFAFWIVAKAITIFWNYILETQREAFNRELDQKEAEADASYNKERLELAREFLGVVVGALVGFASGYQSEPSGHGITDEEIASSLLDTLYDWRKQEVGRSYTIACDKEGLFHCSLSSIAGRGVSRSGVTLDAAVFASIQYWGES